MPEPQFVVRATDYGYAFAWLIDSHGVYAIENTKEACVSSFLAAFKSEYGKEFEPKPVSKN